MLHARIEVAQVLDMFQVRAAITEFSPGRDPEITVSAPITLELPVELESADALTITLRILALWSEMTIS